MNIGGTGPSEMLIQTVEGSIIFKSPSTVETKDRQKQHRWWHDAEKKKGGLSKGFGKTITKKKKERLKTKRLNRKTRIQETKNLFQTKLYNKRTLGYQKPTLHPSSTVWEILDVQTGDLQWLHHDSGRWRKLGCLRLRGVMSRSAPWEACSEWARWETLFLILSRLWTLMGSLWTVCMQRERNL